MRPHEWSWIGGKRVAAEIQLGSPCQRHRQQHKNAPGSVPLMISCQGLRALSRAGCHMDGKRRKTLLIPHTISGVRSARQCAEWEECITHLPSLDVTFSFHFFLDWWDNGCSLLDFFIWREQRIEWERIEAVSRLERVLEGYLKTNMIAQKELNSSRLDGRSWVVLSI